LLRSWRPDEAARAPKLAQVPLIYVQSLGNRDGRPTFSRQELQTMGYAGCIEAQFAMLYAFTHEEGAAGSGRRDFKLKSVTVTDLSVAN
jgi:hypothetical protein